MTTWFRIYKITSNKDRIAWMRAQEKEQIQAVCKAKGVPVPPASSWKQTSTAHERQLAKERGWNGTAGTGSSSGSKLTKSLPSASKRKQEYESESYESELGSEDEDE